jgi:hypothetical protein
VFIMPSSPLVIDAIKRTLKRAALIAVGTIVAVAIVDQSSFMRDSTDYPAWEGPRSYMHLRTDFATGCQYLVTPNGGITPRVNHAGTHIGCKEPKP